MLKHVKMLVLSSTVGLLVVGGTIAANAPIFTQTPQTVTAKTVLPMLHKQAIKRTDQSNQYMQEAIATHAQKMKSSIAASSSMSVQNEASRQQSIKNNSSQRPAQPSTNMTPTQGATNQSAETQVKAAVQNNATAQSQVNAQASAAPSTPQTPITPATKPAPVPAVRTDGMNWNGHHFDIAGFSGTNGEHTPAYTPNVFQWSLISNYYLVEKASTAGTAIHELHVGSEIVLNGRTLHVTSVIPHMQRTASDALSKVQQLAGQHAIGLQTCNDSLGNDISIYWAD